MFGRLLPHETSFFDFFEQHAALTVEGVHELRALLAEDAPVLSRSRRVAEIEHEADVVTHRCVEALRRTLITPIDRDAIRQLIGRMDDVLDAVEAASERVALYQVAQVMPEAQDFAVVLAAMTAAVQTAVHNLRVAARDPSTRVLCVEINRLENEADGLLRRGLARLFRQHDSVLEVIMWKEILEHLEQAADTCEDVANIIEGVILER